MCKRDQRILTELPRVNDKNNLLQRSWSYLLISFSHSPHCHSWKIFPTSLGNFAKEHVNFTARHGPKALDFLLKYETDAKNCQTKDARNSSQVWKQALIPISGKQPLVLANYVTPLCDLIISSRRHLTTACFWGFFSVLTWFLNRASLIRLIYIDAVLTCTWRSRGSLLSHIFEPQVDPSGNHGARPANRSWSNTFKADNIKIQQLSIHLSVCLSIIIYLFVQSCTIQGIH